MPLFVSISHHEPLWVKATGNVAGGWVKNEKGFGYFARGSMPYHGDRSLEFTFNIRVRPFGDFTTFVQFPSDLEIVGDLTDEQNPVGVFKIRQCKAGVVVMIPYLKDKIEKEIDEPLHLDRIYLAKSGKAHIRMNISIGLCSSPPEPRGNIPEWDTQFFQGGLPSLGKKRP
jgi:hypothetical protein